MRSASAPFVAVITFAPADLQQLLEASRSCLQSRPQSENSSATSTFSSTAPDDAATSVTQRRGFTQQRQTHSKARTFVWSIRLSTDRSTVKLHELLYQRETDTQPAMSTSITAISLTKHLKNVRQKTRINSLPCVRHDQHRAIVFITQTDLDAAARRRELHRIVQQVPGDLLQPQTIAFNQQKLIADIHTNIDPFRRRIRANSFDCVIDDRRQ